MDLSSVAIQILALVFAVSVHESAHGWVALYCGDPTAKDLGRISLNPLRHIDPVGSVLVPAVLALSGSPVFGWAKPVPVSLALTRHPRSANLLISAAGPLSNFALAALCALAAIALRLMAQNSFQVPGFLFELAFFSAVINLILGLFNLLPLPPLDGFGVLTSLAPPSLHRAMFQMQRFGMVLVLLLILSGALEFLLEPPLRITADLILGR